MKETVTYYNKNITPVFICSLDAEKAFDSCNLDILFSKLNDKKKLPKTIIDALRELYSSGSASVLYEKFYLISIQSVPRCEARIDTITPSVQLH